VQWPRRLQKFIVRASELEMLAKKVTAIIKAQIRCRFERATEILWNAMIFIGETHQFWEAAAYSDLCCRSGLWWACKRRWDAASSWTNIDTFVHRGYGQVYTPNGTP